MIKSKSQQKTMPILIQTDTVLFIYEEELGTFFEVDYIFVALKWQKTSKTQAVNIYGKNPNLIEFQLRYQVLRMPEHGLRYGK